MNKPAIMIVCPDNQDRAKIAQMISGSEIEIYLTRTAEEAIVKLLREPVNLVISDFSLPGMNGLALAERVKNLFFGVKCLIMVGREEMNSLLKAIKGKTRFFPIIYKPLNPEIFLGTVKKLIQLSPERDKILFKQSPLEEFAKLAQKR